MAVFPLSPWGRGWIDRRSSRERGMKRAQAKQLRTQMTDAERRLWYRLRANRFLDLKFKRQAPIGPYVVDFICFEYKLVVEVDGGQHADSEADRRRDDWLRHEGYTVLRFWNHDVLKFTDVVLDEVARSLTSEQYTPLPARSARHPLPQGERGK
jgi:very-short-patch-repair endonuclease